MSRRKIQYASMTSLLDVVLILMFAALIQSAAKTEAVAKEKIEQTKPLPVPPALVAQKKLAMLSIGQMDTVHIAVTPQGQVKRRRGRGAAPLPDSLIEIVDDPDTRLLYRGNTDPSARVCALVARELGIPDLAGKLIIIATTQPLNEFPYELATGLMRDRVRCLRDYSGIAVVISEREAALLEEPEEPTNGN